MSLIGAKSEVSTAVLEKIHAENLEGIRELAALLEAPTRPIRDPSRIALARDFAHDVLHLFTEGPASGPADREGLRWRVNLSYETMLILIDYLKTYTEGRTVPAR